MSGEFVAFITNYGYLAVFSLIFLQEIGVPNPVPNEVILLFAGSLAAIGRLDFFLVFAVAVLADFIGTSILYFVFHIFGHAIIEKPPRWLPISKEKIKKLADLISRKDRWGIFVGRLIPYLRGYTSVAAGFLQIRPHIFLPIVFLSAVLWSGGYVIIGKLLGQRAANLILSFGNIQRTVLYVLIAIVAFFIGRHIYRHYKKRRVVKTHEE